MASGAADIGVVEGAVDDQQLELRIVAEDTLVLVVGRSHPFAGRVRVSPRELTGTPWILREEGSGTRGEFEAHLASLGIVFGALDVALVLPSNEAVLSAVGAGGYATVLSRRTVEALLGAGRLAAIDLGIPPRRFVALRHRERRPTRQAAALFDLLAEPDVGASVDAAIGVD